MDKETGIIFGCGFVFMLGLLGWGMWLTGEDLGLRDVTPWVYLGVVAASPLIAYGVRWIQTRNLGRPTSRSAGAGVGLGVLLAATLPDNVSYILYSIFLALILGGGLEYIVFHILVARDRPVDVHDAA